VYKFSINRIKKKINDFIINNYNDLFPNDNKGGDSVAIPADFQNISVTESDFINHPRILDKIKSELAFSEEPDKSPTELLKECLQELESNGFINYMADTVK
jgi:hypothetical protein